MRILGFGGDIVSCSFLVFVFCNGTWAPKFRLMEVGFFVCVFVCLSVFFLVWIFPMLSRHLGLVCYHPRLSAYRSVEWCLEFSLGATRC